MLKTYDQKPSERFEPGKLIVQFKPETTEEKFRKAHDTAGATEINMLQEINAQLVAVESGHELELVEKYLSNEQVLHAEPNYYRFPAYRPNDPYYYERIQTSKGLQRQWGLRRINPEGAWEETYQLQPYLRVAVIDSGIDPNQPDLAGKIMDPINFITSNQSDYTDQVGHGTFAAGIIGAVTDNKTGIAGASFNAATIMPIRASNGYFTMFSIMQSLIYAIQHDASVISMSFGGEDYSPLEQQLMDLAWSKGIVCVASAGNSGSEQVSYPAGYLHVLAVSATDQANDLALFSNWGMNIGVAAPGVAILSTTPSYPVPGFRLNYDAADGTSFAAPFVSGVAALLRAVNPHLTCDEVMQIIQKSARLPSEDTFINPCDDPCEDVRQTWYFNQPDSSHRDEQGPPETPFSKKPWDPFYGYGLLDASRAVHLASVSQWKQKGIGSFYGQVVSKATKLPIGGAVVLARRDDVVYREYVTKDNVNTTESGLYADGMFRLMNISEGTYDLYVRLPGQSSQKVQTAAIVPGADVQLRLIV
jgi:thermitase